jgi:desulfoferrodoxin (superoxide reductase-like protein)
VCDLTLARAPCAVTSLIVSALLRRLWQGPAYTVHTTNTAAAAGNMLVTYTDATFDTSGPLSYHVATSTPAKHDPAITISGTTATVKVLGTDGSTTALHPQGAGHYISHIYVKDQTGAVVHSALLANDAAEPTTTFTVPVDATELTAYEFCNIHG